MSWVVLGQSQGVPGLSWNPPGLVNQVSSPNLAMILLLSPSQTPLSSPPPPTERTMQIAPSSSLWVVSFSLPPADPQTVKAPTQLSQSRMWDSMKTRVFHDSQISHAFKLRSKMHHHLRTTPGFHVDPRLHPWWTFPLSHINGFFLTCFVLIIAVEKPPLHQQLFASHCIAHTTKALLPDLLHCAIIAW